MLEFYKEHNVNALAGCWMPALANTVTSLPVLGASHRQTLAEYLSGTIVVVDDR